MAGTIIVDRIESDASYASSINVAAQVTFSNTSTFNAGSVSRPGIAFSGNTSTGMYMPLANTIALTTAGVERWRLDASGNVGVGTSSPTDGKFVITGNSVTTAQGIRLTGDTADARFICESATLGAGILGTFSAHSQLFYTNSTERMRIDSSGNMFVGGSTQNTATKPVYSSTTAKAWVSCSIASSTVTVGASFNVSSVTRNGGGDYTINFSSALLDTSYAIAGIASGPGGSNAQVAGYNGGGVAVGSYRFYVLNMSNITPTEPNNFYLIFFR